MLCILKAILDISFPQKCYICNNFDKKAICDNCQSKIIYIKAFKKNIILLAKYEGVMKKAIKKLKFGRKKAIVPYLGKILSDNMPDLDFDIIITVPLSNKRYLRRGFNQSELIAEEYSHRSGKPLINDVLIRIRETIPQFALKRKDRRTNVLNAFKAVNYLKIKDKNILLIDDIYTTGSTANECCRALTNAGAKSVLVAALSKA